MVRSNFDLVDQNNEGTNANLHWLEPSKKNIAKRVILWFRDFSEWAQNFIFMKIIKEKCN